MNEERDSDHSKCLSPGLVMTLLDGELGDDEKAAALSHLQSCSRCHELAEHLAATAKAVGTAFACLDDERIAAWVDHRRGHASAGLSKVELCRTRAHLAQCERCRAQAELLLQACGAHSGVLDRLRRRLSSEVSAKSRARTARLGWATVAVVGMAALALILLARGLTGQRLSPVDRSVVVTHTSSPGELEEPAVLAQRPHMSTAISPEESSSSHQEGTTPQGESGTPAGAKKSVLPQITPPTETALVSTEKEIETAIAQASAELNGAKESGKPHEVATAAAKLADLYHRKREYGSAAGHYREAVAAAEQADEPELGVDSVIMLGAVLAEMGDTEEARQQFEQAVGMARAVGYSTGEQNALVQLELLPAAEPGQAE